MNVVFFLHPTFLGSESMPRFSRMLIDGMKKRGWNVSFLQPDAILSRIPSPPLIKKWLGYMDQYIIFPIVAKAQIKSCASDTLFVFTDQALGPWVPLVASRPHVIHCHDFLAQDSALGLIKENRTAIPGRLYQWYIRRGYSKGHNFISVSNKTQEDLKRYLFGHAHHSCVVYNGMNRLMEPQDPAFARAVIGKHTGLDLSQGYLLHVGGNQWYKNRRGVIDIYDVWRASSHHRLPLLMIGKRPDQRLHRRYQLSPYKADIHMVTDLSDDLIPFAYSGAEVLLYPSLAEGFGWPIAEAMACGCPVITTDARPMTEVAGGAAFLIPLVSEPAGSREISVIAASHLISAVLKMPPERRKSVVEEGLANVKRFNTDNSLDMIDMVYKKVLVDYTNNMVNKEVGLLYDEKRLSDPVIETKI